MNENEKLLGQVLDKRYEILERIGEGGMAVVYKARDIRLDRLVAVKIMREEMAADEDVRTKYLGAGFVLKRSVSVERAAADHEKELAAQSQKAEVK